jgi:putative transposase
LIYGKKNRKQWVSTNEPLTLARQCELTGINRSTVYAPHMAAKPDERELTLLALIDAKYTRHPFYGSRTRSTRFIRICSEA